LAQRHNDGGARTSRRFAVDRHLKGKPEPDSGSAQIKFDLPRGGSYRLTLLCPRIAISGFAEVGLEIYLRVAKH